MPGSSLLKVIRDRAKLARVVPVRAWALVVCVLIVVPGPTVAQQTGQDGNNATNSQLSKDEIISHLASELVLAAGVGFREIQLGDSMQWVLERWGEPLSVRKAGVLGKDTEILYATDENTAVVFTGRDRIRTISIKGNRASALRTRKGARFGMNARILTHIYSTPSGRKRDQLEYPQRGVNFFLVNDQLDRIVVYTASPF